MGARAQRLPVFHIVGAPSTQIQRQGLITHHTLGDGVFNNFKAASEAACCVSANLTPDNVIEEMERVIREALRLSAPAYISVPMDLGKMPIIGKPVKGVPLSQIKKTTAILLHWLRPLILSSTNCRQARTPSRCPHS